MGTMIFGGIMAFCGLMAIMGRAFFGGAVLLIGGGLIALIGYSGWRAWNNRPERLCTNCYVTAQPLQHKNKRWYCGRCGADNPATLDSPLAQAYFARQSQTAGAGRQIEG